MQQHPKAMISSLTSMRGIAALLVVLFHIDVCLFYREAGTLVGRDITGLVSKGYLWVDFFFVLSGFIIFHAYRSLLGERLKLRAVLTYYGARFARIYPLHFFTLLILVIAAPATASIYPEIVDGSWETFFSLDALPSHVLMTHSMKQHHYLSWNIVSWSIGAEWWAYALAPVLLPFLLRRNIRSAWAVMVFGFVSLFALFKLHPGGTLDITYDYGYIRCASEFLIGLGIYRLYMNGRVPAFMASDGMIVVCGVLILAVLHFGGADILVVPLFAFLVLALSLNEGRAKAILGLRHLQFVGRISYSIYMVHGLVFLLFWNLIPYVQKTWGLGKLSGLNAWAFAAVFMTLTLWLSAFTYNHIEVTWRRRLKQVFAAYGSRNRDGASKFPSTT